MFKNYLLAAWRTLYRNPGFSAINILGLSVALTCCICVLLFARYETTYDTFFKDHERIFAVKNKDGRFGGSITMSRSALERLKAALPEIELSIPIHANYQLPIGNDENIIGASGAYVDSNFFEVFNFPFQQGSAEFALQAPDSIVITHKLAEKLFGDSDPIGQLLKIDNKHNARVTGVLHKLPKNTHFHYDAFMSTDFQTSVMGISPEDLSNYHGFAYLKIHDPGKAADVARRASLLDTHSTREEYLRIPQNIQLSPLPDLHLSSVTITLGSVGDISQFKTLNNRTTLNSILYLSGLILFIACLNFINMSTARAGLRAKEIGIRKVVGATHHQLFMQFMCDSLILVLAAVVIAIGMTALALPGFEYLTSRDLSISMLADPLFIGFLALLAMTTVILAGFYPAMKMSRFDPAHNLRGGRAHRQAGKLRTTLLISQFCVSTILIIVAVFSLQQLDLLRNNDPGYQRDYLQVLSYRFPYRDRDSFEANYRAFKSEVQRHPDIVDISRSQSTTLNPWGSTYEARLEESGSGDFFGINMINSVDDHFLPLHQIPIIAGRNISMDRLADKSYHSHDKSHADHIGAIILSKSSAKTLGLTHFDKAIGATIKIRFKLSQERLKNLEKHPEILERIRRGHRYRVIGIAGDVDFGMSWSAVVGGYILNEDMLFGISLRTTGNNPVETRKHVEALWKKHITDIALQYDSVSERHKRIQGPITRIAHSLVMFSILAITIAGLGLYAMAVFTVERRTKETAIRKVMGAHPMRIVGRFSWAFTQPVIIAAFLAIPVAALLLDYLLQYFTYRVALEPFTFVIVVVGLLALSLVIVGFQTLRASRLNPSLLLRYE